MTHVALMWRRHSCLPRRDSSRCSAPRLEICDRTFGLTPQLPGQPHDVLAVAPTYFLHQGGGQAIQLVLEEALVEIARPHHVAEPEYQKQIAIDAALAAVAEG